jgi:redox-sensitive bicupin YhaK (pirin superfamily)
VSNLETGPTPAVLAGSPPTGGTLPSGAVQVLEPREVPLGGPRAMNVRRTLPQRNRSLIGPWCFLDHYGPDPVTAAGGMSVPPHPHTGLQTVTWLFTGEVEHRDSAGSRALVRPGELNLMTAGSGISHSEVSTAAATVLHGVQLWVALPEASRFTGRAFTHYAPEPVQGPGFTLSVFLGTLGGSTSPVNAHSPLVGAELRIEAGRSISLAIPTAFEHGVLVDTGSIDLNGTPAARNELAYLPPGHETLEITADGARPARLILIGGEPFGEEIVMWWNFVGRSHEEIVDFRAHWEAEIAAAPGRGGRDGADNGAGKGAGNGTGDGAMFGLPSNDPLKPLPAPVLPNARLRPRR